MIEVKNIKIMIQNPREREKEREERDREGRNSLVVMRIDIGSYRVPTLHRY